MLVCPSKTMHLSPSGLAHLPTSPRPHLVVGHLPEHRSDGSQPLGVVSGRWSWWRSGLAPFNAASTSNNSRLWQLCIIHLVEFLSLSSLTLLSASPLSVSLQFFSSFFFFRASRRLEKRRGRTRAVFHQMLPVSPWHQWFWRHRSVCLQHIAQTLWILDAIWTRLCSFFIEAQCLNPLLQHEVWNYYLKIHDNQRQDNAFLISWLAVIPRLCFWLVACRCMFLFCVL